MPSGEHETPVALAKLDPDVVAWLLRNVFGVKVPKYHHARSQATDVRVVVPHTYHADGMLLFCDQTDQPLLAVVLEVQRSWDKTKRRTWKLYVAQLEAELDVTAVLVAYCPRSSIADRYRDLFAEDGLSLTLRPFIFTPKDVPLIVEMQTAQANPALAVLAAICHGGHPEVDAMFPALAAALRGLDASRAILYHDVVLAGLPEAARVRWEAYVSMAIDYEHEFQSDFFRNLIAKYKKLGYESGQAVGEARGKAIGEARGLTRGQAIGRAAGEAWAVLMVLEGRGVTVPDDIRDRILACTDLAQLDTWLRRAATATTLDDVLHVEQGAG